MGLPGFFAWLLKYYKNNKIITSDIDKPVDILYLDSNCLFHPQCFKVLHHFPKWKNKEKLEDGMIKRILNYIDYLTNIVNPQKLLYISVDGVAPLAKMNQQRKRRFRSGDDNQLRNDIKKKYGHVISKPWNNTAITPGTEFMEKLHQAIIEFIKNKKDKVKIIYSSYHSPGEGEHKILQDIKKRSKDKTNNEDVYVIYGLDADLIFLSLASNKQNLYLLREVIHFGQKDNKFENIDMFEYDIFEDVEEELNFVSIDRMKECFNITLKNMLNRKHREEDHLINNDSDNNSKKYNDTDIEHEYFDKNLNLTQDFIFICYFLGNDFLPHIPSIDISAGGLDHLIKCYIDTFCVLNTNLIESDNEDNIKINMIFLNLFVNYIAKGEDYFFKKILPKHNDKLSRRRPNTGDPCGIELWNLDNMKLFNIYDPIELGNGEHHEYKFRYYEHYFNTSDYQRELISDMCKEYLKGILWVTKYYFEECVSWEWQYPYSHGPFISDLSALLDSDKNFDINKIKFKPTKPINPCTQLLAVLPPHCIDMLPSEYRPLLLDELSPIIDLYPTKIELDMINKDMYWKCIPFIPSVDINRIKKAVKNIKLQRHNKIKNAITGDYNNYSNY